MQPRDQSRAYSHQTYNPNTRKLEQGNRTGLAGISIIWGGGGGVSCLVSLPWSSVAAVICWHKLLFSQEDTLYVYISNLLLLQIKLSMMLNAKQIYKTFHNPIASFKWDLNVEKKRMHTHHILLIFFRPSAHRYWIFRSLDFVFCYMNWLFNARL